MSTPTVIEARIELERVTSDPFVSEFDRLATDRAAAVLAQAIAAPRRRIYD